MINAGRWEAGFSGGDFCEPSGKAFAETGSPDDALDRESATFIGENSPSPGTIQCPSSSRAGYMCASSFQWLRVLAPAMEKSFAQQYHASRAGRDSPPGSLISASSMRVSPSIRGGMSARSHATAATSRMIPATAPDDHPIAAEKDPPGPFNTINAAPAPMPPQTVASRPVKGCGKEDKVPVVHACRIFATAVEPMQSPSSA